jgi:VanZ family protein
MAQLRNNSVAHRLTQQHNNPMTQLPNNLKSRFLVVGLIASIVAIADEVHQSFVPFRDASVTDVFLDLLGISLVLIVFSKYYMKSQKLST